MSLSTAVVALIPYIVITTAYELFRTRLGTDLHTDKQTFQIISSIATAGYAFGAMMGGDVVQRFKQWVKRTQIEAAKRLLETFVIDHAEKPSPN